MKPLLCLRGMPFSISAGVGFIATFVIGGVLTSSLLPLVVRPAINRWFEPASTASSIEQLTR